VQMRYTDDDDDDDYDDNTKSHSACNFMLKYTKLCYTILYAMLYYGMVRPVEDHFPQHLWTSRRTSHRIANHPIIIYNRYM